MPTPTPAHTYTPKHMPVSGQQVSMSPQVLELLQLELLVVVSHPGWVLQTKLTPSARVICALNCWALCDLFCFSIFSFMWGSVLLACKSCTVYMLGTWSVQMKAWDPLKLELEMSVSRQVGAGNRTRVLSKSRQCSSLISLLRSPRPVSKRKSVVFTGESGKWLSEYSQCFLSLWKLPDTLR